MTRTHLRPALRALLAAYLSFFLCWVVPIHACAHLSLHYHTDTTIAKAAVSPDSHHPDDCQLCRLQGNLANGQPPVLVIALETAGSLSQPLSLLIPSGHSHSRLSPRAPPVPA